MKVSKPIKITNVILFLKLMIKKNLKNKEFNIMKIKFKVILINQKKMNYLIYIQKVIYQNLKIISLIEYK